MGVASNGTTGQVRKFSKQEVGAEKGRKGQKSRLVKRQKTTQLRSAIDDFFAMFLYVPRGIPRIHNQLRVFHDFVNLITGVVRRNQHAIVVR